LKLVILDRDGVINEDSDAYIKSVAEWQPIPGSLEAIARLSQAGWRIFIASNQSGIGRGLFDYDALAAMRKPAPGMLRDIARRLQVDLAGVPFVGDSASDLAAAKAAGARPILVRTGKGRATEAENELAGIAVYDDLAAFAAELLATDQRPQTA
jgi:D-glycero-D-manno-heptose 1,7-bisphosphate phosphatase